MYLTPDGVDVALAFGLGVPIVAVLMYQAPSVMLTTILNWREWRLPVLWVVGGIYVLAEWELGPRVAWRLRGGVWVAMTALVVSWFLDHWKTNRRPNAGASAPGSPGTTDG